MVKNWGAQRRASPNGDFQCHHPPQQHTWGLTCQIFAAHLLLSPPSGHLAGYSHTITCTSKTKVICLFLLCSNSPVKRIVNKMLFYIFFFLIIKLLEMPRSSSLSPLRSDNFSGGEPSIWGYLSWTLQVNQAASRNLTQGNVKMTYQGYWPLQTHANPCIPVPLESIIANLHTNSEY